MHITNPFANPEKIIGICGGGQLGKMLCEAASAWDWKTAVLDKSPDDPAARLAHKFVQGDFTKYEDVLNFGKQVDVLTIEIEKVNLEALIELEKMGKIVHPSPRALGIIKDKALQKQFFIDQGLPTVPQELFDTKDDVLKAIESGFLQIPFVQKLRTDGYDGRGVAIIRTEEDLNLLLDGLCLVEPLVEIEAPTNLRFEADLPEAILERIKLGAKMKVKIASISAPLEGTVSEIAPIADAVSRTFQVKFDLPQTEGLRTGQFGRVSVPVADAQSLTVPTAAVIKRGQMEIVFVAASDHAQLRLVKTGKMVGGDTEILSGLEEGEAVIINGITRLEDGQPVTIQP